MNQEILNKFIEAIPDILKIFGSSFANRNRKQPTHKISKKNELLINEIDKILNDQNLYIGSSDYELLNDIRRSIWKLRFQLENSKIILIATSDEDTEQTRKAIIQLIPRLGDRAFPILEMIANDLTKSKRIKELSNQLIEKYKQDYVDSQNNKYISSTHLLVPVSSSTSSRLPNLHSGAIWTSDDFDQPLPDEFWMAEV